MRRAFTSIVVAGLFCTALQPAERKSWTHIRYVGGTVNIQPSRFDWNTTLSVTTNPDMIVIVIAPGKMFAPQQTVRIRPNQVTSISTSQAAWSKVGGIAGVKLPQKPSSLFGLLQEHGFIGIVYQGDDGKTGALLLDSYATGHILLVLKAITGKPIEDSP
jgi:hypothetical protein